MPKSKKKTIDKLSSRNLKQFIKKIDNKIFKPLKDSPNKCNLLLIKIKNNNGIFHYIKRSNGKIEIPSKLLLKILKGVMNISNNKLCSYTVNKSYISSEYDDNNISFVLFSKHINVRTKEPKYIMCGLLFLKEFRKNIIYLSLICAKAGLGGVFLSLAENISKHLGYDTLKLVSIDDPLGFYIHKGYKFKKGKQTYEIPDGIIIKGLKTDKQKQNIYNSYSELMKHAGFLDSGGHIITLKNSTKILTKKVKSTGFNRHQLKELNKKVDILFNIKKDDDGIFMSKKL